MLFNQILLECSSLPFGSKLPSIEFLNEKCVLEAKYIRVGSSFIKGKKYAIQKGWGRE